MAGAPQTPDDPLTGQEDGQGATLVIGNIGPDDSLFAYDDEGTSQDTVWEDSYIHNSYERDGGVYMMGVTSPGGFNGDSVAFAQLQNPTLLLTVDWSMTRSRTQPTIPNPASKDPNWILLDVIPETNELELAADGVTPIYTISGTYVYGHRRPDKVNVFANVSYPVPPWMVDQFDRTQPTTSLDGDLIQKGM